ncbi:MULTISPECIES: stage III sporulation protein AD [Caloramator]|uniref:Stage III sporulation protein AD n=1 Tax=Caloramator proteoclasticus DSM 10124 TaxID=1121262 RepID=A0A1M4Y8S0_9CLOT|nr:MULTISPECIES: stage III sporulation protein AD [Caloramator]SHF01996.1 stage III sporulation protein AD [Caloramator proteoclasticus DSM 10124]
MEIVQIVLMALILAVILTLLSKEKKEIAIQVSILFGIVIFFMMLTKFTVVIQAMQEIALKANIDYTYVNIVFKIIAISYIASFGIEICKDIGQSSLASKIEFAGKILILVMAIPIIMAVMEMVLKLLP